MKTQFARIRWRLVGWNMLILGLILALAARASTSRCRAVCSTSRPQPAAPQATRRSRSCSRAGATASSRSRRARGLCQRPAADRACARARAIAAASSASRSPPTAGARQPAEVSRGDSAVADTTQPTFATIALATATALGSLLRRTARRRLLVVGQSLDPARARAALAAAGAGRRRRASGLLLSLGGGLVPGRARAGADPAGVSAPAGVRRRRLARAAHAADRAALGDRPAEPAPRPSRWRPTASCSTTCAPRSRAWSGWPRTC